MNFYLFVSAVVQWLSLARLFVTPWTAACQASVSFTISQSLVKFMSIDSVMPSSHLILCHPLLLTSVFPRVFSDELALWTKWPKYWDFSFSIRPSNEYSGLISFRLDWFTFLSLRTIGSSVSKHCCFSVYPDVLKRTIFWSLSMVNSL